MTLDECRELRSKTVRYVGITGDAQLRAKVLSVSARGVRVRFLDSDTVELVHPNDLAR